MTHYRAYFIGHDGHFMKAVDLICDDDEGARKCARKMVDGHDVELWQHDRRIEKYEGRLIGANPDQRRKLELTDSNKS